MGRKFVPTSTIFRRMDAKDARMAREQRRRDAQQAAALAAFRRRTAPGTGYSGVPVVEVAMVPDPEAVGPVVDVTLEPVKREGAMSEIVLVTGNAYDTEKLVHVGWTAGDGSGTEGYDCWTYFEPATGVYLGPDAHGIEPTFRQIDVAK